MFASSVLWLAVGWPQSPPATVVPRPLAAELAALVDLPTPAERQQAAATLARRPGVTVAEWLAACAAFGEFPAREPGPGRHVVALPVLDKVESTEVHLYVPRGSDPARPAPLLLWGHGAGGVGTEEYRRWQAVADQLAMYVLAPTECTDAEGWSFIPRERQAQLAALRWARRQVNVDENAIFVGGVSRGGHMAWDLALRQPDLWAGMVACIGGPRMQLGEQNNLRYFENVAQLPIRDLQGTADDPLLVANLRLCFDRLKKAQAADAQLVEFADRGHDFDLQGVDWVAFFGKRRLAVPPVVVRTAADPGELRAGWAMITGLGDKVAVQVAPQVDPARWSRLDEAGQRALVLDKLVERTARLQVRMLAPGRFAVESRDVKRLRLLFTEAMLGPGGAVEVLWQGRSQKRKLVPSAAVLLAEFAERFDRTFLPVAELALP